MFKQQLNKLNQSLLQLKELTKCPICFDPIQELVELSCRHRFCKECFTRHKSTKKQLSCPLCKTIVKRRSILYKDEIANILGKFVNKVSEQLNTIRSSDLQYTTTDQVSKGVASTDGKTIANKNHAESSANIPTTSKGYGRFSKDSCNVNNNEDAFDKLMKSTRGTLVFNKKGTKATYNKSRKGKVTGEKLDYKILNFQDNQNKVDVLKWLNDNRNQFDRLTQTQNILEEDTSVNITQHDLPSVSQAAKLLKVNILPRCRYKGRAKSLDIDVKKVDNNKKRHSDGFTDVIDNYTIEESNTEEEKVVEKAEENVLLNFIEDGYLNKLETELRTCKKVNTKPHIYTMAKTSTASCAKGWDRLLDIKKTVNKSDKAPKQLNITLQASQNSSIKKVPISGDKINKFNLTCEEEVKRGFRCPNSNINKNDNETNLVNNTVEILDDVQGTSINSKLIQRKSSSSNNDKTEQDAINSKINKLLVVELPITHYQKGVQDSTKINQGILHISDSTSTKEQIVNNMNKSPLPKSDIVGKIVSGKSYDYNTLETYMVQNMLAIQNKDTSDPTVGNEADGIKEKTSLNEKQNENKIQIPHIDRISKTTATKILSEEPFLIDDDYLKPTQKLNASTEWNVELNDQVSFEDSCLENVESFDDLLNIFERPVGKCFDISKELAVKIELHKLKTCFNKIRALYGENTIRYNKSIVSLATVDVGVQNSIPTSNIQAQTEPVESRSTEVQTKIIVEDVTVQTDIKTSKTMETQTESYTCVKCIGSTHSKEDDQNSLSQNTKLAMESILEEQLTESNETVPTNKKTQMFTATLDNFNFETQEMSEVKQTTTEKEISRVSQGIPNSVLLCTVNSSSGNKVNKKLLYERGQADVSKRSREDDSDDEICQPVKRNRFIRNDLSVKFETQMTQQPDDKVSMSCADNDSIDYDNYLAEVMRKYDEGKLFSNPSKNEQKVNRSAEQPVLECDNIAATVNKNIENLSKAKKTMTSSSGESFRTASSNDLEKNIEDIMEMCDQSEQVNTENTDIIGKTESMEPLPKRLKTGARSVVVEEPDVCGDLNDSLDDAEFELSQPKIHILGDILLNNHDIEEDDQKEDDLFSDDDIVETTPQKNKGYEKINLTSVSLLSQFKHVSEQDVDCVDFDFAPLPPPPDFQDDSEAASNASVTESKEQTTIIDANSTKHLTQKTNQEISNIGTSQQFKTRVNELSLTPDNLSPFIRSEKLIVDKTPEKHTKSRILTPEKRNDLQEHRTPLSVRRSGTETLGFSPITADKSVIEPHTSRVTPSAAVAGQVRNKHNILTSTPKQKSIWNYVRTSQPEPPPPKPKPCIACTRLSKDQVMSISQLTNKKLATYSTTFDANVTHMIVSVDENNCLKDYTMKSMAAVAAGIWVLRFEWIQECLNSNSIVDEEPYEVLDDTGQPGPRTSRLTRSENPLLGSYKFFCADPFFSTTRKDLEEIIKMLGGKIVPNPQGLVVNDNRIGLIITEGRATQDFEIYENWLEKYKMVTVDIEWLSKSVARYKLLSIRPYVWCTDDCLDDLNYPAYLIEYVALTVSEA